MIRHAAPAMLLCLAFLPAGAQPSASDTSPHKAQFVTVGKDVTLEVLDWGGDGPPLVFLAGWGNTAHAFDSFAPRFTGQHHVYGITRRGSGRSGKPPPTLENYDSETLADDVLSVIDALKLDRPVLAGHSVAGQEMSSIGTRHPEKVSGLIYLEAAYAFAYYDPNGGYTVQVEADSMRRDLEALMHADDDPAKSRALIQDIESSIPNLKRSLDRDLANYEGMPQPNAPPDRPEAEQRASAMRAGRHKYQGIKPPVLAIIAVPYDCKSDCDAPYQKAWAREIQAQADAFQAGNPAARIVRLAHADHNIIRSNPVEVERAMNAFMDSLPKN